MVQINFAQKSVNVKIVYYGPGMSGKTTNLEVVHQRAPKVNHGDLTSISTDGDRTLFFDYMPLDLGTVAGMRTCFQVYTVPGQVYYNSTRKLVLQGVDGVIFVADSAPSMMEQNLESLRNLEENLNEYGKDLASLPHVIQYNKRDLPDALPIEELERHLNRHGAPTFEAVANTGQGVFPTLKSLAASVLKSVMQEASGSTPGASHAPTPAPAPQATPAPAAPPQVAPAAAAPPSPQLETAAPQPMAAQAAAQPPPTQPGHTVDHQLGGAPGMAPAQPAGQPQQNPYAPAPTAEVQTAPQLTTSPGAGPAELMQTTGALRRAPRKRQRAHSVPQKQHKAAAKTPASSGGGGAKTAIFITVAAGVGAALAYVALTLL